MPPPSTLLSTPRANRRWSWRPSRAAEHDVRLLGVLRPHHGGRRARRTVGSPAASAPGRPGRRQRGAREGLADQLDHLGVVEVAGGGDHDAAGRVAAAVETVDLPAGHRRDGLGGAGDQPAQRVVAVDGRDEQVVHLVAGLVVVHGDLFEDHPALGLDVGRARSERRPGRTSTSTASGRSSSSTRA